MLLVGCVWGGLLLLMHCATGEVYSARNVVTSELVAIKVERVDSNKQVLKLEVAVLKKLQSECPLSCPSVSDPFQPPTALTQSPSSRVGGTTNTTKWLWNCLVITSPNCEEANLMWERALSPFTN